MNTYGRKTEIYAAREPWQRNIELRIVSKAWTPEKRDVHYAQTLTMLPVPEDGMVVPPTMVISYEDAQQFMDELWTVGIRPTEGTGSAGSLAATQAHLSDMRAIVAKQLSVELPKK